MKKTNNQTNHPKFLALTSLKPPEFMRLLSVFGPLCEHCFQHHDRAANRLEGKPRRIPKIEEDARCSLLGSHQKLFLLLSYLKENPRQHYHAERFETCLPVGKVQQPKVRLRFKKVRDQVMLIACGLHNLRAAARNR